MDTAINTKISTDYDIMTEAFILDDTLYNAAYIAVEELPQIMLEKVISYPNEQVYHKNKINMVTIDIISSNHIKLTSYGEQPLTRRKDTDIALAAATAANKFGLTQELLKVDMDEETIAVAI